MTQEQLVDICRLMDINKDGLVDLNEFLESFRLAEKSLQDDDIVEIEATWHEADRRQSKTAVDKDETGVQIEILRLHDNDTHVMGVPVVSDSDDIQLIDSDTPKRAGLLESDI